MHVIAELVLLYVCTYILFLCYMSVLTETFLLYACTYSDLIILLYACKFVLGGTSFYMPLLTETVAIYL